MPRRRITNFGLPAEIGAVADLILEELPGLGFSSRTDIIKAAMRDYCFRLLKEKLLAPNIFIADFLKKAEKARDERNKTLTRAGQ